jgi:hypothetical protein
MIFLSAFGSVASILGLALGIYIWRREEKIETEISQLTLAEEKRHDE